LVRTPANLRKREKEKGEKTVKEGSEVKKGSEGRKRRKEAKRRKEVIGSEVKK
jgi:hypothetical protein